MGRAKLKMEFITKEKVRNTTYEKRKHGLIKKAQELSTLCDVVTSMIIYPPNSTTPEVFSWPENPDTHDQIKKSIAAYKSKGDTKKKHYGLKYYFEERKKKVEDELVKARKRNLEAKYATWFDELDGLSEGQLRQFAMELENKENAVRDHLECQKRMRFVEPVNYQYGGSQVGFEQVQVVNQHLMNHGLGWFDSAPTTSFIPLKSEVGGGYGYPMFDGGMVYGNPNPWMFQPPVVQCGLMPELGMQELDPQVNMGVGDFVMDDHRGGYMGS